MLQSLCGWLEKTPLSAEIQNVGWVIPLSQIVHILCLAVALSSMVFLDVRLLGAGFRNTSVTAVARTALPAAWIAVALMAFSGAILIIGEPRRDLLNLVFQTKMALLVCALAVTFLIQHGLRRWPQSPGEAGAVAVPWPWRAAAGASLCLWLAIAVCGRFIAYFMG
jgi:hypothetical protein